MLMPRTVAIIALVGVHLIAIDASAGRSASAPQATTRAATKVKSKSLAHRAVRSQQALHDHMTRATSGDAYFARPARVTLWHEVDRLSISRTTHESAAVKKALSQLRTFHHEFGSYRDTGDQRLQLRMFHGYSKKRPGMIRLLQNVHEAAGLGPLSSFRDNAPR